MKQSTILITLLCCLTPTAYGAKLLVHVDNDTAIDLYDKNISLQFSTSPGQPGNPGQSAAKAPSYKEMFAQIDREKTKRFKLALSAIFVNQSTSLLDHIKKHEWDNDTLHSFLRLNTPPETTHFYKNGEVEQVFRLVVSKMLFENHFPQIGTKVPTGDPDSTLTGLVIKLPDSSTFVPSLIFEIKTEDGKPVYSHSNVDFASFKIKGMAYFAKGPLLYKNIGSVGKYPFTIEAMPSTNRSTIIISNNSYHQIISQNKTLSFLATGNVIIVYAK